MVYDIFSFFYELDLLEIRLNILDKYVDKFVIVESTESFMGKENKLYFDENKKRFEKWKHKIIHYVVDDYPTMLNFLTWQNQVQMSAEVNIFGYESFIKKKVLKSTTV